MIRILHSKAPYNSLFIEFVEYFYEAQRLTIFDEHTLNPPQF